MAKTTNTMKLRTPNRILTARIKPSSVSPYGEFVTIKDYTGKPPKIEKPLVKKLKFRYA